KLAVPGTGVPWKPLSASSWDRAVGLGPYRVVAADSMRKIDLARAPDAPAARGARAAAAPSAGSLGSTGALADTISLRFTPAVARVRTLLRSGRADLVWPLPPGMSDEPALAGYRPMARAARPERWLVLVMRADVPPTTKLPARHALGHGINR